MNFIESFFSWGEKPKEEIKISNGRNKLSKRFRKPKPKVESEKFLNEDLQKLQSNESE
jgi:hypothetical protein